MIKGIFFDVDGTLLDTTEYIYQAFEYSLKSVGNIQLDRSDIKNVVGKPLKDCYRILTKSVAVEDLVTAHRKFQMNNLHLSSAFHGAKETLQKLKEKGVWITAITSRARDSATVTLEQADLMKNIDLFIGIEDVVVPKPDPEGINKALAHFGVLPQEAIMVGDSDVDIMAGKSADTKTIGVTYGFHGKKITESQPDFVINEISEILSIL